MPESIRLDAEQPSARLDTAELVDTKAKLALAEERVVIFKEQAERVAPLEADLATTALDLDAARGNAIAAARGQLAAEAVRDDVLQQLSNLQVAAAKLVEAYGDRQETSIGAAIGELAALLPEHGELDPVVKPESAVVEVITDPVETSPERDG